MSNLFILTGLPGSGKTTFAKKFLVSTQKLFIYHLIELDEFLIITEIIMKKFFYYEFSNNIEFAMRS